MKEKYTKMHKTQRKITLTQINSTGPSENRCKTQKNKRMTISLYHRPLANASDN